MIQSGVERVPKATQVEPRGSHESRAGGTDAMGTSVAAKDKGSEQRHMRWVSVLGGGTGSFSILSGLRTYEELWIQSIVTMMDSGGDSGRLRDEFGVLPPGDLRRCLVALSEETQLLRDLFSFRFVDAPLEGRSFGNLFFWP